MLILESELGAKTLRDIKTWVDTQEIKDVLLGMCLCC